MSLTAEEETEQELIKTVIELEEITEAVAQKYRDISVLNTKSHALEIKKSILIGRLMG